MDQSRRDIFSAAIPAGAVAALALGTAGAVRAATPTQSLTSVVTGTATNATTGAPAGTLVGTLALNRTNPFQVVNGVLTAAGTLTGNIVGPTGAVVNAISQAVTVPLAVSGSCEILNLTLGPLDLNLLGLMIHLNQVVLNITAVPGAGNLLGNLLCAVANLLNGGGALSNLLTSLSNLLNQIIASL